MAEFHLQIAGQTAAVRALFESTPHHFSRYLSQSAPDFSVTVTEADLRFEQAQLDEEALREGFKRRIFTDPFLERAAIQRKFAEHLLCHDTLLLHASAVAVDGKAYLFTGKSGTGKSTHTRFWLEAFGSRALMINDDKPFLRFTPDAVWVCGSPWSGKHGLDTNVSIPLAGICLLQRGSENRIRSAAPEQLLPRLLHESYQPQDPHLAERSRALAGQLSHRVRLWCMECTRSPEAAQIAHRAMSE